jgi:hypothetical protein
MKGMRLRLTDHERDYLLRLIENDTKLQGTMISKSISKLTIKIIGSNES